ncbi:hypothetical protein [Salinirubrum litoreum]|uniref:Uncharacterized protein n=1 Tax=Salinirubrum litoreum TaxID=1126234 RepID=A0ABD5RCG4_9EURY|nr:hypothetical protein [Salinirubrum litoreum]
MRTRTSLTILLAATLVLIAVVRSSTDEPDAPTERADGRTR